MRSPARDCRDSNSPKSSASHTCRDGNEGWSRRAFLTGTAATLCSLAARPASALSAFQAQGIAWGHLQDWYPLQLPPRTSADLRELTCAPAFVDMGDGRLRGVLAYNGLFPGPTWIARTGDVITVRLVNDLDEETITHWHGLVVNFENDGGPLLAIGPGQTYDYNFEVR